MKRIPFLIAPLLLVLIIFGYCYGYRATRQQPIVYQAPGFEQVTVETGLVWADLGKKKLLFDLYRPPGQAPGPLPVVVFVHGDGPESVIDDFRTWGQMTSWARNAAAVGLAAVTFDHSSTEMLKRSSEVADELDTFVDVLRDKAPELGLDPDRICLWSCSSGVPFALRTPLAEKPDYLRCLVAYYGAMSFDAFPTMHTQKVPPAEREPFDLERHLETAPEQVPPILLAWGAQDSPALKEAIRSFTERARELGVPVEELVHEEGEHAFDLGSDDQRAREIIRETLEFLRRNLLSDPGAG